MKGYKPNKKQIKAFREQLEMKIWNILIYELDFENGAYHPGEVCINNAKINLK